MMAFELIYELFSYKWLIFNAIIFAIIYQTILRNWNYFSKQNVKFVRGFPLIGVHFRAIFGLETISDSFENLYKSHPNESIIGMYEFFGRTTYLLRDLELIKRVTIKDFDHFVNHSLVIHEDADPLMGRAMFAMDGQRWKEMRSTMSPAFTGSKMRLMFGLLLNVAQSFTDHLKNETATKAVKYELKPLFERLASDTIATCAFGLNVNSLEDKNNEFYTTGQSLLKRFGSRFFLFNLFPKLMQVFKIQIFNDEQTSFFRQLTKENMAYRIEHNITRNDMIDILIEAQKGTLKHTIDDKLDDAGFATVTESSIGKDNSRSKIKWTDDDMAAQSMTFFFAGFFGMVIQLCFTLHELAVNTDVQEKLYLECKEIEEKLQGKPVTYEAIQKMKYMDMVVSEILRRWSFAPAMDRAVTKPYVVENADGSQVKLNVGDSVWVPNVGLHMNAEYFPNPKKFDPERFSDANRTQEMIAAYMPFGIGPRNCIGSRFALMEAKTVLYLMVLNLKMCKCDQTQDPLKLKRLSGILDAEKGFWLNIESR